MSNFRRRLKARLPQPADIKKSRWLSWFSHRLHDPNLWHFGRRSVSRAAGIGMCVAFFPIPIHMLFVAPIAIFFGINLPVLIAAVWVTNPITWVPIFYFAYRLGVWLMGGTAQSLEALNLSADWSSLQNAFAEIWLPLCLGSAICGIVAGTVSYLLVETLWRYHVRKRWRARESSRGRG